MSVQNVLEGDSLLLLKEIPDESVDLIIADPPYNLGKDYGNNKDLASYEEYLSFSRQWLRECKRILKSDGVLYIFMGMKFIAYLYQILETELELTFNSWITWYYTQGVGKIRGYSPRHEDILVFTKDPKKFTFNLDDIRIPQKYFRSVNNMRGANPGNVWEFSHMHYCHGNRQSHPTQKPEGLIERIVLASSNPGDTILDPFLGSGTTLRVCQQLDRNGIGIELNPDYVQLTEKRLEEPFSGFDSIDERMFRLPIGLKIDSLDDEYLQYHLDHFFKNHESDKKLFLRKVKKQLKSGAE